ncbi:MAG: hypothetical protein HZA81_03415 [Candidatus Taylorbacteria bacterium]|nr:hypothetical protein [Candidatus Taylorbacteria bacterium]
MNKKGIIALVVIIVLAIVGYMVWGGSETTVNNEPAGGSNEPIEVPEGVSKDDFAPVTKDTTDTSLIGRLKVASVAAAETGTRVALANGKASFSEGDVKGTITLGDVAVEKEVGGTKYVIADLAVNSGGSGTFKYVVLFEDSKNVLTDKSYAIIGDRVSITGIRGDVVSDASGKAQLIVSVSYLAHDQGEPLSSKPSVPRTKILVVENGMFNPAKEINI